MQRFRRKPATVEAVQWFEGQPLVLGVARDEIGPFVEVPVNMPDGKPGGPVRLSVDSGDFVIKHEDGHVGVCSPDVFLRNWDPVEEPAQG